MRKVLSLLLAFTLILGVVLPASVNAAGGKSESEKLFDEVRSKFEPIRSGDKQEALIGVLLALFIKADDVYDDFYQGLVPADKDYLGAKNIEKTTINDIMDTLLNNLELIKKMINDPELSYSAVSGQLDEFLMELYNDFPYPVKASIEKYAPNRSEKIDLMTRIGVELLKEKIGKIDYSLKTKQWIWNSMNLEISSQHIKKINMVIGGGVDTPLKSRHLSLLNSLLDATVDTLGPEKKVTTAKLLNEINVLKKVEIDKETTPGGGDPGGSPGGGTPVGPGAPPASTPTTPKPTDPPKVELPTEKDKPARVVVGKDNAELTKDKVGKTNVKVKEAETVKAIEELRKQAGKTKAALIELNLDDLKGLDFNLELPQKLVASLIKNNVSLKVKTANSDVEISIATLKEIKMDKDSRLEFRVEEKPSTAAIKLAPKDRNVKKLIDLNLLVVSGDKEEKVKDFKEAITVKIDIKGLGHEDKLGVYYLNEERDELEFVTGKIRDGMAILKLKHFSQYAVLESNITFEDIKAHWAKIYVESMAAKQIIDGYQDGTFKPNGEITRAEFSKLIVLALELDLEEYKGRFTDVKADAWYSDYVATMAANGLAEGYGDGSFKANDKITRAEMAMIIANTLDTQVSSLEKTNLLNKFNDKEDLAAWVENAVAKVAKENIVVGDAEDNFNPSKTTTRGEAATAIYRLYNK